MARKCPTGTICISSYGFFILFLIAVLICILILIKDRAPRHIPERSERPIHIKVISERTSEHTGDGRYSQAPQALRDWRSIAEMPPVGAIADIPIGITTRGLPEKYQSVGVITTNKGETLPLYGRRTYSGGDRWNYYTRTDTYNPVQIPVQIGRRDCTDDTGCNEISNGDEIMMPIKNDSGRVTLYNMSGPRYFPTLI